MADAPRLNGFDIPHALLTLMLRPDWRGKRTSEAWLRRFNNPPSGFVDFCTLDHLVRENANVRSPDLTILWGAPNLTNPPGDFDAEQGFIIGFVEWVDDSICIDFRPGKEPRVIFFDAHVDGYSTAFDRLDAFCAFYKEQHGA